MSPLCLKIAPRLLPLLLCAAIVACAQDDPASRGIEAFRETCLLADPRFERIHEWAADRELKYIEGQGPQLDRIKTVTWEVAASGTASVRLNVIANYQPSRHQLDCRIIFGEQRDLNKRIEIFFLDQMKLRPNAKQQRSEAAPNRNVHVFVDGDAEFGYFDGQTAERDKPYVLLQVMAKLAPPGGTLPQTFATPKRSYRLFINSCLGLFPDIDAIAQRMTARGWQPVTSPRANAAVYLASWNLSDPFKQMSSYGVSLVRSQAFRKCSLSFDTRAAVPLEQLIRDYGLKRVDSPYPSIRPRPSEKVEYYSAQIAGTPALVEHRTDDTTNSGELSVLIESRQ